MDALRTRDSKARTPKIVRALFFVCAALLVLPASPAWANTLTFTAPDVYDLEYSPRSVVTADFDGDGDLDLAFAQDDPDAFDGVGAFVEILVNDGDGTFTRGPALDVGGRALDVESADFNGDGKPDLVVANNGDNNEQGNSETGYVSVLINESDGAGIGFSEPFERYATTDTDNEMRAVATGDFDGDGITDIAASGENRVNETDSGFVMVLLGGEDAGTGNGDGTFTVQSPSITVGPSPEAITSADFDGDDGDDLAVSSLSVDTVSVLSSDGDGTFTEKSGSPYTVGSSPYDVTNADFDGDGDADLATSNSGPDNVTVLSNDGAGGFAPFAGSPFDVGPNPESVVTGDFNDDGELDLVTGNYGDEDVSTVSVLLGEGGGSFEEARDFDAKLANQSYGDIFDVAVGDFDNDGRPDLATANYGRDQGAVLINKTNRDPNAEDDAATTGAGVPTTMNVLDNDADPDADFDGDILRVTRNTDPDNGTVECESGGECAYTPDDGFDGTDRFSYIVGDGKGGTDIAVVRITVNGSGGGNPPPSGGGQPGPGGCTVSGTLGRDVLYGTDGRDVICGLGGGDIVFGGGGGDLIKGGPGNDLVYGGAGDDRILGEAGNDVLRGQAGKDTLLGGPGKDKLVGGPGKDKLVGGPGKDKLVGGPGKDKVKQ